MFQIFVLLILEQPRSVALYLEVVMLFYLLNEFFKVGSVETEVSNKINLLELEGKWGKCLGTNRNSELVKDCEAKTLEHFLGEIKK